MKEVIVRLISSLCFVLALAAAGAAQVVINFESIPGITATTSFHDGCCVVSAAARLSDQLRSSDGVSFRSTVPYIAVIRLGSGHATSGVNGIGGVNASNIIKYNSPVIISFNAPGSPSTPAVTDFVSIRSDTFPAFGTATMEAFDVNGTSIGTVSALDGIGGLTLTLSIPNIHSVRITQTRSDIAFDDLRFNTPVPLISQPPVADAGSDQSVHAGQSVILSGSASSDDDTSTENLVFAWSLTSKPEGSTAVLIGGTTMAPQLTADLPGEYVASLTVTDEDGQPSEPDTVAISSLNAAPVADAGADKSGFVGQSISLDGSASFDPDADGVAFSWTLTAPDGTSAAMSSADTAFPTFTPTMAGAYTASLTVTDPFGSSASDSVMISAILSGQYAADQIAAALNIIGSLSADQVTSKGNRQALQKFLTQALAALHANDNQEAIQKLNQAIERTDGCFLRGSPDGNGSGRDWIVDCAAQYPVYDKLTSALNALTL